MGKVFLVTQITEGYGPGSGITIGPLGKITPASSLESVVQIRLRTAGTLSKMTVCADGDGTSWVFNSRKAGANGNMSVDFTNSTLGVLRDDANSDTVAAGNSINYAVASQSSSNMYWIGEQFEADSGHVMIWGASSNISHAAATTYWLRLGGRISGVSTSEANAECKIRVAGTAAKLQVTIFGNNLDSSTVFISRKNGADGNLTLTVGASATGVFEDTTHSDTLANGDTYKIQMATGGTSGQLISPVQLKVECTTTAGRPISDYWSNSLAAGHASTSTEYFSLFGSSDVGSTTEDDKVAVKLPFSAKVTNFRIRVSVNSSTSDMTARIRVNKAVDGNELLSVGAGATGWFEDTTHFDLIGIDQSVGWSITGVSSGTSMGPLVVGSTILSDAIAFGEVRFGGQGSLRADTTLIAGGEAHAGEARLGGLGGLSVLATQLSYLHPDADDVDGGWTNELGGTILAPSIDEALVPNDTDYIKSSGLPGSDVARVRLSGPPAGVAEPVKVKYRYRRGGPDTANLVVTLYEGATPIASWTHSAVGDTFVTAEQTLTAPQFAAISDFNNLYIGLEAQT